ncbi:MAG: hypothetical protein KDA77_03090 [Planctomycetaceae bacterium]|nr:hypothetical protein [Planctomycetaceae bacterium]
MTHQEASSEERDHSRADSDRQITTKFVFQINELSCWYAIWAFLFAWYGLAVNDSQLTKHLPPVFGFLQVFGNQFTSTGYNLLFFCLVSTGVVTGLLFGLRALLPDHLKCYLCWRLPKDFEFEEKQESAWPAVLTLLVCLTSIAVFLFAISHLRVDRSHRRPIVSWVGPAADQIEWVFALAGSLVYLTIYLAGFADGYFRSRWNWLNTFACGLLGLFFAFAFILSCAALED